MSSIFSSPWYHYLLKDITINVYYNNTRCCKKNPECTIQNLCLGDFHQKVKRKLLCWKETSIAWLYFIFKPWVSVKSHMALLKVEWEKMGRKWLPYWGIEREDKGPGTRTGGLFWILELVPLPVSVIICYPFPVFLENKGPLSIVRLPRQQESGKLRKLISSPTFCRHCKGEEKGRVAGSLLKEKTSVLSLSSAAKKEELGIL